MVKCPKCGFENEDEAKFCAECGERLPEKISAENVVNPVIEEGPVPEEVKAEDASTPELPAEPETAEPEAVKEPEDVHLDIPSFKSESTAEEPPAPAPAPEPAPAAPVQQVVPPAPVPAPAPQPTEEEIKARQKAEKEKQKKEAQAARKAEIKALPKKYRPVSAVKLILMELLFFAVPAAVEVWLYYTYYTTVNSFLQALILLSGPLLALLITLFYSFFPKNENVRAYARSRIFYAVVLAAVILVLWLTGGLKMFARWLIKTVA